MADQEKFYTQVRLIALHLGKYWTYDKRREDENGRHAVIKSKSGGALNFYNDTYRKRVTVSGEFPDDIHGRSTNARYWGLVSKDSDFGSIGISPTRDPKAAASDIRRRLADEYIRLYPLALQKRRESFQGMDLAKHIMDAISRVCPARKNINHNDPRNPELSIDNYTTDGPRGSVKYSTYDGRVDLKLTDIQPECAIQMLALMQNYHNERLAKRNKENR